MVCSWDLRLRGRLFLRALITGLVIAEPLPGWPLLRLQNMCSVTAARARNWGVGPIAATKLSQEMALALWVASRKFIDILGLPVRLSPLLLYTSPLLLVDMTDICLLSATGKPVDCYFCSGCGSHVYHHQAVMPDKVILRTLLLDGGPQMPATGEIFTEGKLSWVKELT
jgi:hypothetical protein